MDRSEGAGIDVGALTAAGLGLDHDVIGFGRTSEAWLEVGGALRAEVEAILREVVIGVEQVGSSSVAGLLAKPIVDLAVGVTADQELGPVRSRLEDAGWIYRGDAGGSGGHVFVLEARPWHRVAHVHVVDHDGEQWRAYLRFRDALRGDPEARARYEAAKQQLAEELGGDREAYQRGKAAVVDAILRGA